MKRINKYLMVMLVLIIASCQDFETDLNVTNFESPNDEILGSDPVALLSTAGNIMNSWFITTHSTSGPGAAFATMADVSTCSWGNFGMRDLSSEPRVAFNNTSSYGNNVTRSYFNSLYSLLTDSNTIVAAVENGTEFDDPQMVLAMGKFGQALSIGYLALVFDKVWLYDAEGPIGEGDGSTDYETGMAYALDRLDEAIAIADANSFTLPESWIPGYTGTSENLSELMNSIGARMLVSNVRNTAQKTNITWSKVIQYADNGITNDFEILMDDVVWYDLIPKTYLVYPGWARLDMRIVNMLDPTQPDYWTEDLVSVPESTSPIDARLNSDFEFLGSNSFRPERGKYHFSNYRYSRYDDYITEWTINVTEFSKAELDMYKAEALLMTNDVSGAAAIVNAGTRTTRGELPAVAENSADIQAAIHHERLVEFSFTSMGLGFFEMRKEDQLQSGTLLHFPVPGEALDAIPADYYTFGGTSGVAGEDYSTGGWR